LKLSPSAEAREYTTSRTTHEKNRSNHEKIGVLMLNQKIKNYQAKTRELQNEISGNYSIWTRELMPNTGKGIRNSGQLSIDIRTLFGNFDGSFCKCMCLKTGISEWQSLSSRLRDGSQSFNRSLEFHLLLTDTTVES